jgi:mRNA interferase MazF
VTTDLAPIPARLAPVPGQVVWVALSPTVGREQAGHRPALIVASPGYLAIADTLALVVPVTTAARGWPNHVPLSGPHGLTEPSVAMTEQLRAVSRSRITGASGLVDRHCLDRVRSWLADFLDLPAA